MLQKGQKNEVDVNNPRPLLHCSWVEYDAQKKIVRGCDEQDIGELRILKKV